MLILATIYSLFLGAKLMTARIYNADCNGSSHCLDTTAKKLSYTVLSDYVFVSRLCIELGLMFLAMQVVSRLFYRK